MLLKKKREGCFSLGLTLPVFSLAIHKAKVEIPEAVQQSYLAARGGF